MKTVRVNLGKRSYDILIGFKIIKYLGRFLNELNIGKDAYVISNTYIRKIHGELLKQIFKKAGLSVSFKLIPDTEKSKSLKTIVSILKEISAYDRQRRVFIVAFGGGVIGDVAGFAASIYKRGIPYVQIPTTLLAQVDSSIGGKTAVDIPEAKNLIGAFYQPRLVFSELGFLKTLDSRQIKSGLAEVIKYAVIKDKKLFEYLEKNYKRILALNTLSLEYIILRSSAIKAKIVEQDEREEKGIRTILNFGHTVGHAIEAAAGYSSRYSHGEAIALGMLVALDISSYLGLLAEKEAERIKSLIRKIGLPSEIKDLSLDRIIKAHYRDKKFIGKTNRFVLIERIGTPKIKENIPLDLIRKAIALRLS